MNRYDIIGWICRHLLDEQPQYRKMPVPERKEDRRQLMRSLINIRPPLPVAQKFLQAQDTDYYRFLEKAHGSKLVLLEYGVGFNTPPSYAFPSNGWQPRFRTPSISASTRSTAIPNILRRQTYRARVDSKISSSWGYFVNN